MIVTPQQYAAITVAYRDYPKPRAPFRICKVAGTWVLADHRQGIRFAVCRSRDEALVRLAIRYMVMRAA